MRRNGDGSYYLHDLSGDEAAAAYVNEVAAQEDVTELYAQVNEEYAARLSQDEVLAAYLESYQNDMVVAVGEALEEQTTEAETARRRLRARKARPRRRTDRKRRTGIPEMRKAPAPHPSRQRRLYTVSDTLNIRSGASETSDRIATCYPGESLEILMKAGGRLDPGTLSGADRIYPIGPC